MYLSIQWYILKYNRFSKVNNVFSEKAKYTTIIDHVFTILPTAEVIFILRLKYTSFLGIIAVAMLLGELP